MSSWRHAKLGDIATIERSAIQPSQIKSGTIYVGLEHIDSSGAFRDPKTVDAGMLASSKFRFTERHLLYGKLRPYLAKIACPDFGGICSTDILPVLPGPQVDRRFLFYYLHQPSMVEHADSQAVGVNLPRLSPSTLAQFEIPLPPLTEQRRIAAILDQAGALRAKRQHSLEQVEMLTQSLFVHLFGDAGASANGWLKRKLGAIAGVQGGLQLTPSRSALPCEVPYLRVANVYRDKLDLHEIKKIRATEAEVVRTRLQRDDILVVEGHGNPNEIGRCALWDGSIPECVHQNHLIRVRCDMQQAHPVFVSRFLNSQGGRQHLLRSGKTTSGLNTISVSNVRDVDFLLPPISLQHRFAKQATALTEAKPAQQKSLARMDALFASLEHRAFAGEL